MILHSSKSNEWHTPSIYLEAARRVLRTIDLDPASCHEANKSVRAAKYYTEHDRGLDLPWCGNVWMNPPYGKVNGRSNQAAWTKKLLEEYSAKRVHEAICLVNAQTAEKWFQPLWEYPICFTDHRIRFVSPDGLKSSPTHGNVFIYCGPNIYRFHAEFSHFGRIIVP